MKKFVTVIISFLVLLIFLVLNYLLWDKENLIKLRDNDKIEQDWLRGQNLTLQRTVERHEQAIKLLTEENVAQKDKIMELESKVSTSLLKESENLKAIQLHKDALRQYKSFMKLDIKEIAEQWFSAISNDNYEESAKYLDKNFRIWSRFYNLEEYVKFVSAFQNIAVEKEQTGGSETFVIIDDTGDPYEIRTRVAVDISLKRGTQSENQDFINGPNMLELLFVYVPNSDSWAIKSISTIKSGKP